MSVRTFCLLMYEAQVGKNDKKWFGADAATRCVNSATADGIQTTARMPQNRIRGQNKQTQTWTKE